MPFNNILEAMQDLLIAGAAFEIAQIKARHIAANAHAIGIRPTGDHASTSVPGTSRATALKSSVASLR
jgi:5-carboxymethyl-2-hydroxymuconate isomerase